MYWFSSSPCNFTHLFIYFHFSGTELTAVYSLIADFRYYSFYFSLSCQYFLAISKWVDSACCIAAICQWLKSNLDTDKARIDLCNMNIIKLQKLSMQQCLILIFNIWMLGNSNKIVSDIIRRNYSKKTQSLYIFGQPQIWKDVLQSRDWKQLKQLLLYNCQISDHDIQTLARLMLPNLVNLEIGNDRINVSAITQLLCRPWNQLQSLILVSNMIGDDGMHSILMTNQLPVIHNLNVSDNFIGFKSLVQICNSRIIISMMSLNLSYNNVGSRGAKLLAKAQLEMLSNLNIKKCEIGSEDAMFLSKAYLPNIKCLQIGQNRIDNRGFIFFANYHWQGLKSLKIETCEPINMLNIFVTDCYGIDFDCQLENERIRQVISSSICAKIVAQEQPEQSLL